MRRIPKNRNQEVDSISSNQVTWKKRPSEIKGYTRTFYCTDVNGDYLRVDYNLREKRARLYLEDNEEGGLEYYSIISDGRISMERNLSSGRTANLHSKFSKRADIFSTIPNRHVLKIIGDNYNISSNKSYEKNLARKKDLEITRQKYFVTEKRNRESILGQYDSSKSLQFIDFVDIIIGLFLIFIIFYLSYNYFNFMLPGIIAAIYGISLGIIDMFFRRREPIFVKIMLFVIGGFIAFIYGYYIF